MIIVVFYLITNTHSWMKVFHLWIHVKLVEVQPCTSGHWVVEEPVFLVPARCPYRITDYSWLRWMTCVDVPQEPPKGLIMLDNGGKGELPIEDTRYRLRNGVGFSVEDDRNVFFGWWGCVELSYLPTYGSRTTCNFG